MDNSASKQTALDGGQTDRVVRVTILCNPDQNLDLDL